MVPRILYVRLNLVCMKERMNESEKQNKIIIKISEVRISARYMLQQPGGWSDCDCGREGASATACYFVRQRWEVLFWCELLDVGGEVRVRWTEGG